MKLKLEMKPMTSGQLDCNLEELSFMFSLSDTCTDKQKLETYPVGALQTHVPTTRDISQITCSPSPTDLGFKTVHVL